MSLLEDVFLEDEAGEAQELERVIEGDEFDERPGTPNSNENSEKEDEAEEDKRRVDHTAKAKRPVRNPRFVLNPARLTGPRGIQIIPEHFKDFKFKGKGHELEDLDCVLKKLEHWAYRLYPKFKFDDCLKKIEALGKKRPVMVHLHKIRTDQFMSEETVVQKDSSDEEAETPVPEEDEFDRLLQQQIELARATPAPGSVRKELYTPTVDRTPLAATAPKAFSSPSISDEQKERMIRNKKLAEERRLAKLNQLNHSAVNGTSSQATPQDSKIDATIKENNDGDDLTITNDTDRDDNIAVVRKHNRSNVIDSSDDESDVMTVSESISVDVHNTVDKKVPSHDTNNTETGKTAVDSEENIDSDDAEIEIGNENRKNNEGIVIQTDSIQRKMTEEESFDTENTASGKIAMESRKNIKSNDVEIVGNEDSKNNGDKVMETDSNRHKTIEDAISDTENTASEVMAVESLEIANSVDEEMDTNVMNKDKVIEADSFDQKAKEDTLKTCVAAMESDTNSKIIDEDSSNDKNVDENDPNSVNIANLSNDINKNVDEALTITDKQSTNETVNKNKQIENEVPIEDLMDIDFSDDF